MLGKLVTSTENFDNFTIEDLPNPLLRSAYQIWLDACDESRQTPPLIKHFSLNRSQSVLPFVAAIHLSADHKYEPRYLHAGKALTQLYGKEVGGKFLRDLFPGFIAKEVRQIYHRVLEQRRPIFSRRLARTLLHVRGYDRLLLPVLDNTQHLSYVFLVLMPNDGITETAADWREDQELSQFLTKLEASENAEAPTNKIAV